MKYVVGDLNAGGLTTTLKSALCFLFRFDNFCIISNSAGHFSRADYVPGSMVAQIDPKKLWPLNLFQILRNETFYFSSLLSLKVRSSIDASFHGQHVFPNKKYDFWKNDLLLSPIRFISFFPKKGY